MDPWVKTETIQVFNRLKSLDRQIVDLLFCVHGLAFHLARLRSVHVVVFWIIGSGVGGLGVWVLAFNDGFNSVHTRQTILCLRFGGT